VAKTKRRAAPQQSGPAISPMMIGVVAVAAILIVGGIILLSNQGTTPTPAAGTLEAGTFPTVGDPNAPVTITEYGDFG